MGALVASSAPRQDTNSTRASVISSSIWSVLLRQHPLTYFAGGTIPPLERAASVVLWQRPVRRRCENQIYYYIYVFTSNKMY
jgi:hypothetical protein